MNLVQRFFLPAKLCFCLAKNAPGSCIGILYIGAGFSVKVQHFVKLEGNLFDPIIKQVVEDDGSDTDFLRHLIHIFQIRVFLFHDRFGLGDRFLQKIFQPNHIAASGGKLAFFQADQTIGYMNQILCPGHPHLFNDLEPLCKVQFLFQTGNIQALVKVIGFFPVHNGCQVTGRI